MSEWRYSRGTGEGESIMWYYKRAEPGLWTVMYGEGHNRTTDSDHDSRESAAERAAYLNGAGNSSDTAQAELLERIAVAMERQAAALEKLVAMQDDALRLQAGDYGIPIDDDDSHTVGGFNPTVWK